MTCFMNKLILIACGLIGAGISLPAQQHEHFNFAPKTYLCYYTDTPLAIDGELSEKAWQQAAWTDKFVDIEGHIKPVPYYDTRVKMLWDSQYFYIAAELEEPQLWATYSERDMVIFHENDFEVFIDPTGDAHHYYELEINALGTIWDLLLTRPYRDGGKAIDAWDITGLLSAVKLYGTLNDPSDEDERWTLELALPWAVLEEAAAHPGPPADGESWRVNFSRVQWRTQADSSGVYQKRINPATGEHFPEHNWVWSPQGAIAMHQPETWGHVQFSTLPPTKRARLALSENEQAVRWQLWQLYYEQQRYHEANGRYSSEAEALGLSGQPIRLWADGDYFWAIYELGPLKLSINQEGLIR